MAVSSEFFIILLEIDEIGYDNLCSEIVSFFINHQFRISLYKALKSYVLTLLDYPLALVFRIREVEEFRIAIRIGVDWGYK